MLARQCLCCLLRTLVIRSLGFVLIFLLVFLILLKLGMSRSVIKQEEPCNVSEILFFFMVGKHCLFGWGFGWLVGFTFGEMRECLDLFCCCSCFVFLKWVSFPRNCWVEPFGGGCLCFKRKKNVKWERNLEHINVNLEVAQRCHGTVALCSLLSTR